MGPGNPSRWAYHPPHHPTWPGDKLGGLSGPQGTAPTATWGKRRQREWGKGGDPLLEVNSFCDATNEETECFFCG